MTDRHRGPDRGGRDAPGASAALGAGAALFNERRFLAARDAWNRGRRSAGDDRGDDDERLLRALAATAAATH
ncbi:hypothetical protein EXE43_13695, partial [Halorubrum sp. SS5]